MKKGLQFFISLTLFLLLVGAIGSTLNTKEVRAASTGSVTLQGTILQYLSLEVSSGDTIAFGNITPGTPECDTSGTVVGITTNAANGYTLALSDGVADADSSMTHTDTSTKIADMSGTIASPADWVDGTTTGVAASMFEATTNKEVKWGSGTTACGAANKWAGLPETATTAHTVTGYHAGADSSSWGWKVDVPNTQKTGVYSGTVLFTSSAVLS